MDFWELFITALMPVLKVLLITATGTFLALDRFHILVEESRKNLNRLVFFVFGPALVCSNLAKSITFKSMTMLWFMPINSLLAFIIGSALGWLLVKIAEAPDDVKGLVLGCCAAGNLGSMVFIIVLAVCKETSHPFGAADVCYKDGLAYSSLSMAIGAIYVWSYVYNIVRIYSGKRNGSSKANDSMENPESAPEPDPESQAKCSAVPLVTAGGDMSQTNNHMNQLEIECTILDGKAKVTKRAVIKKKLKSFAKKLNLKVLVSPSTVGSIVGLTIGAVPQIRKAFVGDNAPLHVIQDSASMLGDAAIPTITLIVGANLLNGLKKSGIQLSLIFGIIIVRYVALPVLGVGIVKGALYLGLIHPDPLYQFVLLLQFALPPAINLGTITQLFGVGESECSVIMLATYACASVSLTLWSTFFMWLVL